jgi:E3 ubiquitin-protein ligase DZIP3
MDISADPEPVNALLEIKKVLNPISALPKGVFPNIEKFIQEDFSFQTMQVTSSFLFSKHVYFSSYDF